MRDVNNGWLIRYFHSNTASAFFFLVYLHIGKGLYYGSYKSPRTLVWTIGTIIFLIMMATAFLGYVLPYGQMSLWGATVITNLMSAIPWVGQDIVEFIWGGFSVNNATLNRFFSLHFVLPFVLAALVLMHLIALHDSAGSGNPLGISGNYDRLPFAPYFIFKDLVTIFIFFMLLSLLVFFMPNLLGDSENYVMANPMQTPPAIVPEWYLLPFYAILRSIPNKLLGVIAMFSAILILLVMPFVDLGRNRGIQFRPLSKIAFYVFVGNFFILLELGAKHVESPFIEFGQISTVLYFSHFLIIIPFLSVLENSLIELIGEESLNENVSYNNLILQRSPERAGIATALGSAAVVNGTNRGNATENEEETSAEGASGNSSENAANTNSTDIGSGDLEKEQRIYKILNDCHSEVQDQDGDPTGTIETMMERILVKQHEIVQALIEMTSSGSGT
jgi:ubiquinol-cytochrome c reductase cytochrome b subunit